MPPFSRIETSQWRATAVTMRGSLLIALAVVPCALDVGATPQETVAATAAAAAAGQGSRAVYLRIRAS